MKDNEVYQGLVGGRHGKFWWGRGFWDAEGQPASVHFDYQLVLDRWLEHRDVVGFYHTHPHFTARPSSTDYQTMGAWTVTLGCPLVCLIEGTDGLKAHWFIDDETSHITGWVRRVAGLFVGNIPF